MGVALSQQGEVFCFFSSLGSLTGYEASPPTHTHPVPCQHLPTRWTWPFPYHCVIDRNGAGALALGGNIKRTIMAGG